MAFISAGYDGTVDEVQFAGMLPKAGNSEYGVVGAGDFAVTAVAGQDRTLSIAPGASWGHSVTDSMDINETRALAVPTNGSRWDLISLRRDWQPPGGATTVSVTEGGTGATLPARENRPGILDDQPIALVRVDAGSTTVGEIIDLRCWGRNGGVYAKHDLVRSYLNGLGTHLNIDGVQWVRTLGANNLPQWEGGPQRMYRLLEASGEQRNIPRETWTTILNWTAAKGSPAPADSGIGYSAGSFIIPKTGRWRMSLSAAMGDHTGVDLDRMDVRLRVSDGQAATARGQVNVFASVNLSKTFVLKANDTVTAETQHYSGTTKGLHFDPASQWWDAEYVGPA